MDNGLSVFQELSKKYNTPAKVQTLIRSLTYNEEKNGETIRSALEVYGNRIAHCLESSLLSAAILEQHEYEPQILSLDSQDDLCHAVFLFKEESGFGSVGLSKEEGLHGRAPHFKTIEDLAMSYFDPFVDDTGKLTGYQVIKLDESGTNWRTSTRNLWALQEYIWSIKHIKIEADQTYVQKLMARFEEKGPIVTGKHWW